MFAARLPNCPECLERACASQGFDCLVDGPRVDGDHQRDRPAVCPQDRFSLTPEGVANLFWPRSEIPNSHGFHAWQCTDRDDNYHLREFFIADVRRREKQPPPLSIRCRWPIQAVEC